MSKLFAQCRHRTTVTKACTALLVAAVLNGAPQAASAQERSSAARSTKAVDVSAAGALEREFWACDYAATSRGVLGSEALMCGETYEALKRTRFHGDARAMLEWWQQHKTTEHHALAAGDRTVAAQ